MCGIGLPPPSSGRSERGAVPNLPNVSEHQRRYTAGFMTSKARWSATAARQACTRVHRIAIRVGLMKKPKQPRL